MKSTHKSQGHERVFVDKLGILQVASSPLHPWIPRAPLCVPVENLGCPACFEGGAHTPSPTHRATSLSGTRFSTLVHELEPMCKHQLLQSPDHFQIWSTQLLSGGIWDFLHSSSCQMWVSQSAQHPESISISSSACIPHSQY